MNRYGSECSTPPSARVGTISKTVVYGKWSRFGNYRSGDQA